MRATWLLPACLFPLILWACGGSGSASGDPLDGTRWALSAYGGTEPVPGTQITVEFEAGEVRGSAGCNSYAGVYRYIPGSIEKIGGAYGAQEQILGSLEVRDLSNTEMACLEPKGSMEQEAEYLGILRDAQGFRLTQNRLQISPTHSEPLTFVSLE